MKWMLVFCLMFPTTVLAHKASDSFLTLEQTSNTDLSVQWDISLIDLERNLGLDQNQDGQLTWAELTAAKNAVFAFSLPALKLGTGQPCSVTPGTLKVNNRLGEPYASLAFDARCAGDLELLTVNYGLLFDTDPGHRGFFRAELDDRAYSAVFAPSDNSWSASSGEHTFDSGFTDFVREGVWHIWIGYDHIAFLFLLLLPAVLRREQGSWVAESSLRKIALDVTKVVTAFTLAHSITLSAAALNIVSLPGGLVEMAIAASVIIAGLHNVFPDRLGSRWMLAFVFGLVHGFGFANVLSELGNGSLLLIELIGFNIGVELGQLAIALIFVPAIFLLATTRLYRNAIVPLGSVSVALVAGFWLYERALTL